MNNFFLQEKLIRYINAGFPILYINSYEEEKVDAIIKAAACGRDILEWNGANGYVDFKTKARFIEDYSLEDTLSLIKSKNESNIILNGHTYLLLKQMI